MRREIKFRAKTVETGKWIEGYYVQLAGFDYIVPFNQAFRYITDADIENSFVEIDVETLSQRTGFSDKNGVEIYEGVIFRYHAHRGYILLDFTGHVIFENGSFGFVIDPPFNGETIKYFSDIDELKEDFLDHIEVIGNIHDYTELLK